MNHHLLIGLSSVILLGMVAQWLAWRLRLPSILLLLLFGLMAGPVTGLLDPDHLLGELLLPIVSLSVAVILFEGGMSLRLRELKSIGHGLLALVTVGIGVAWVLGSLAARALLGLDWPLAVLLGAILVVTGPTVVLPLLRHVQPRGHVGALARWEGILNDPVGAVLAILVFEAILSGGWESGFSVALSGLWQTVAGGVVIGLAGAAVMVALIRYHHLPDYLQSPFTLMMVVVAYAASDLIQKESGLLTVTVMGIAVANQRFVLIRHIIEFKENLRVILISFLFILLAARLQVAEVRHLGWQSVVFLFALILVVRPATVFASLVRSDLGWRERTFMVWMAPRGIVAAAVASVVALRLAEEGYEQAELLVPVVFLVIVGTVLFYGLTAAPVGRWLGVAGGKPEGCLFVGAHAWARTLASALQKEGLPVILIDTNRHNLREARLAGLTAYRENALADHLPDELPLEGIGRALALTANDEVNALAVLNFSDLLGRREIYQLPPEDSNRDGRVDDEISLGLRGRFLFDTSCNFAALTRRFREGAVVKTTKLTEEFTYGSFRDLYGESANLLFTVRAGALRVQTARDPLSPRPGEAVIALVDAPPAR